jgi:hypothetical protein
MRRVSELVDWELGVPFRVPVGVAEVFFGTEVGAGWEPVILRSSPSTNETERRTEFLSTGVSFRRAEWRFLALSAGVCKFIGVETAFFANDPRRPGALLDGIGVLSGIVSFDFVESCERSTKT